MILLSQFSGTDLLVLQERMVLLTEPRWERVSGFYHLAPIEHAPLAGQNPASESSFQPLQDSIFLDSASTPG